MKVWMGRFQLQVAGLPLLKSPWQQQEQRQVGAAFAAGPSALMKRDLSHSVTEYDHNSNVTNEPTSGEYQIGKAGANWEGGMDGWMVHLGVQQPR